MLFPQQLLQLLIERNEYMTTENTTSGTPIALTLRPPSPSAQPIAIVPNTIPDLLEILEEAGTKGMPMLRTACGVLATFLSTPVDRLTIQAVFETKDLFRTYLVGRKYAENSIRTYVNHAKILINSARAAHWAPVDSVPEQWREVLAQAKKQAIRKNLVKYLAAIRPTPTKVTSGDDTRWTEEMIKKGFSMTHTRRTVGWLWRTLIKLGVAGTGMKVRATKYQVPVAEFPSRLKSEVVEGGLSNLVDDDDRRGPGQDGRSEGRLSGPVAGAGQAGAGCCAAVQPSPSPTRQADTSATRTDKVQAT
jgi:hypothetical protein